LFSGAKKLTIRRECWPERSSLCRKPERTCIILMAYLYPGNEAKAALELYPINGKKLTGAATQAGLTPSPIPALSIEGDNRPGLAHQIAQAVADAGVNLSFLVAHVVGKRYAATIGFESEADADKASALIRKATASRKK
jgi:hypothetical protein